jgi:chromosomal replication initiation ATPase DnaA
VSSGEELMAKALGQKFTYYVGKPEQSIVRTNYALRINSAVKPGMTEQQKAAARSKMIELEKLRRKQYPLGKYSFQQVLDMSCFVYGVAREQVLSNRRFPTLVRARQAIIVMLRDKRGLSWTEIGRKLNRDHSTVMHNYFLAKSNPDAKYAEFAARIEEHQS